MLITFVLGAVAGWGAGFAEEHVRTGLSRVLSLAPDSFNPVELRSMALVAALFIAAVLAWLIGSSSAVALMLGAVVGVLGPRIRDAVRAARAPDYDA